MWRVGSKHQYYLGLSGSSRSEGLGRHGGEFQASCLSEPLTPSEMLRGALGNHCGNACVDKSNKSECLTFMLTSVEEYAPAGTLSITTCMEP